MGLVEIICVNFLPNSCNKEIIRSAYNPLSYQFLSTPAGLFEEYLSLRYQRKNQCNH